MIIAFTGSQSGMTKFQEEELAKIIKLKECSEFIFYDVTGSNHKAANIARDNGVKTFTIYPPEDIRKQAYTFDPQRKMMYNRIETPYMEHFGISIKWMPVSSYFNAHSLITNQAGLVIATPKEFKFSLRSAVWSVIKKVWKDKKDIIIIPPIERPEDLNGN